MSQASAGEIRSLTTVRGIAALWVVLLHFSTIFLRQNLIPEASALKPLWVGGLAVPLFFILSGYVLALRYTTQFFQPTAKCVVRFCWLRLGRIYPLHLGTLLLCVALAARREWPLDQHSTFERFVANCMLTHAWNYSWDNTYCQSWNYPSWSISSEWFVYLLFPLLAAALVRLKKTAAAALAVLACAAAAAVYAVDEQRLVFAGLAVVLPTFIGGMALAAVCPPGSSSPWPLRWAGACAVVGWVLPFVIEPGGAQNALYIVLFFFLVAVLGMHGCRRAWLWQSPPLVYLGEISYSLYMTHAITITLLARFFPFDTYLEQPFAVRFVVALGCLAVTLVIAAASYGAVEQPCRRLSRRFAPYAAAP